MTRIWSVTYETDCGESRSETLFTVYGAAVKSINKTFPSAYEFPTELQVTDNTSIGFSPAKGEWVQLEAVMAHSEPVIIK